MLKSKYFLSIIFALLLMFLNSGSIETFANEQNHHHHSSSSENGQADVLIEQLKEDLKKLGVKIGGHGHGHEEILKGLDEETKKKAKEIFEQKKEGKLTHEEAKAKLEELGVKFDKPYHHKFLDGLDDETRKKAEEIMEQVKEEKMTFDEAEAKLKELGVELPDCDPLADLDDQKKMEVKSVIERTKEQLEQIGKKLPRRYEKILEEIEKSNE